MAMLRWNFFFCLGLFVSPVLVVSADQAQSGFRRLYVLQPGPSGSDSVHVSSISSRSGAAGQPHAYNVELTANYGRPAAGRSRRMGNQAVPIPIRQDAAFTQQHHQQVIRQSSHSVQQTHQMQTSGVNVCGGQCCHGWSKAQGSQRCTQPNCIPQCQNGGMCLRPQHCVCKPGSKGEACEQRATPPYATNVLPQRPIPQQGAPLGNVAQMRLTVKPPPPPPSSQQLVQPHYVQQHIRPIPLHPGHAQQYYHTHTQRHTQVHAQAPPPADRPLPLSMGHHHSLTAGNHTGRIKVVFTPTICKVTCIGGRCHNNCERGNTTTIISENGHATDTLTAPNFRVVVCHLPCMNGGKCSARDKCQCPPSFTGKFCQVPVQSGHRLQQQQTGGYSQTQVHSTHTLPLTYSNGQNSVKFSPGVVNIHVKHPPEASVQIHQVSQVDAGHQKGSHAGSSSSYSYRHTESSQKIQHHHGHALLYPGQHGQSHQVAQSHRPVSSKSQLGRCFQETMGSPCGKALPGLSKQDDCCSSFGTSWGFNKCQTCPKHPSTPMIDCPQGYKRINTSHCQDVNECHLQGACPNGDCVNTLGSYRCMCNPGYMPDHTLGTCIPATAVAAQEEKGACFRLVGSGRQCLHPVSAQLSKQLCCCSVGKAWGSRCEKCPSLGTAKFKEICPGGIGYTVLPKPPVHKPVIIHREPVAVPVLLPLPTPERPVEAFGDPEVSVPATAAPDQELLIPAVSDRTLVEPDLHHQLSPGVSTVRMEQAFPVVVERTSPPEPVEILPTNAGQDIAPTQLAEVDECHINPYICGQGICYNTAGLHLGYTCHCYHGYRLSHTQTTCVDVDECVESPSLCSRGRCTNTPGSFRCVCQLGFMGNEEGTNCIDVDECLAPHVCPGDETCFNTEGSFFCRGCPTGFHMTSSGACEDVDECLAPHVCPEGETCFNTEGSFFCRGCPTGFHMTSSGACEDVDECQNRTLCPSGICHNQRGGYRCGSCPQGLRAGGGRCVDIDECLDPAICANGKCVNYEGSFSCLCNTGFHLLFRDSCQDVDECQDEQVCTRGHCQNTQGSFLCHCGPGFKSSSSGDWCEDVDECVELARPCETIGQCVNSEGSYMCLCPRGYQLVNGTSCLDVNECLDEAELCTPNGDCLNTEGSYQCVCESGFEIDPSTNTCNDIDECVVSSPMCGPNSFCENTEGSYQCLCDQGYQESQHDPFCVDVNECELLSGVCGAAQCENVDGSFLCTCPRGQEYNHMTASCGYLPTVPPTPGSAAAVERKECYFRLSNENLCESVLTSHVTLEECCCTLGAGWGDNCEVHPCPVNGTDQFNQMCPSGRGYIPNGDTTYGHLTADDYKDADECALFGKEVCKGGYCLDMPGSYECYCKTGLDYDPATLECREHRKGAENHDGAELPEGAELHGGGGHLEEQQADFRGVCWQLVTKELVCTRPLDSGNRNLTYTECCCLHSQGWGLDCALCPGTHTEAYATMCNLRPYGRDALMGYHEYYDPEYTPQTEEQRAMPLYEDQEDQFQAFEGVRKECGVLSGCKNGRCVRVRSGYTCDCFDGYDLDMARMACVDVDECSELNAHMSLCKNAKCINTRGSFKCVCLPGYVSSGQPNHCVPRADASATAVTMDGH